MPIDVSDIRSNPNEQIEYAAKRIGKKGTRRRKVFDDIYRGKKNPKTAVEIAHATGLSHKEVLDAGKFLDDTKIVEQTKVHGKTAYKKEASYKRLKSKIQMYADHPKKLKKLPTKYKPDVKVAVRVGKVAIPKQFIKVKMITIDELEQFKKVKGIKRMSVTAVPLAEKNFKKGIQKIIGEAGTFTDWGGEPNDLLSTRVKIKSTRVAAAFAFKGPGKKGILTPAMMGKNGDQIARLFKSSATLFILQYWNQVADSIYDAMKVYATFRSVNGVGELIHYCVIDGQDSAQLINAYGKKFG